MAGTRRGCHGRIHQSRHRCHAQPCGVAALDLGAWAGAANAAGTGPGHLGRGGNAVAADPRPDRPGNADACAGFLDRQPYPLLPVLGPVARSGRRAAGRRRQAARADALCHARFSGCDQPVQFPRDQPRSARKDDRDRRRKPAQGPAEYARRSRQGASDPPHRSLRADPICPGHPQCAGGAAGDLPALDQPLLHSRPDAGEKLHSLGGRTGHHRVHGLVAIGRRQHEGCGVGRLYRRANRRDRNRATRAEGADGAHHRLLRGGHDARCDARSAGSARGSGHGQERDLLHRASRFRESGGIAVFRRRRSARTAQDADPRRLSRRALYGGGVQPIARARPDLELRHQQLSAGQGLCPVRSAPLEWRHHQSARAVAHALSGGSVPRQSAEQGRCAQRAGHADRPRAGEDAELYSGRARGPYRTGRKRVGADAALLGPAALRAGGVGAYCRGGQPAEREQISILGQSRTGRHA
ncbi:unnamed protein product [Rhizophagus irregularis]|uniref:Uncharacterized protein n=1 Tax=Rhizophagus irregularis TaxID=588596 RepID=A0A915ZDE4_9GLOM|nr:unnamed protein product [Rhizophagus irregularis]